MAYTYEAYHGLANNNKNSSTETIIISENSTTFQLYNTAVSQAHQKQKSDAIFVFASLIASLLALILLPLSTFFILLKIIGSMLAII